MSESAVVCPRCAYQRKADDAAPANECPECGVIYAKFNPSALSDFGNRIDRLTARPREYVANHVPLFERLFRILFSILIISYALYGAYTGDLFLPGKRQGLHIYGEPIVVFVIAAVCAAAAILATVIDHYDKRNNEHQYKRFAKIMANLGVLLAFTATVWAAVSDQSARPEELRSLRGLMHHRMAWQADRVLNEQFIVPDSIHSRLEGRYSFVENYGLYQKYVPASEASPEIVVLELKYNIRGPIYVKVFNLERRN